MMVKRSKAHGQAEDAAMKQAPMIEMAGSSWQSEDTEKQ